VWKMKAARTIPQWENLQALAVVWVENVASAAGNAGGWAGETDTTALSPLGLLSTSGSGGASSGRSSTAWGGGWAASGGSAASGGRTRGGGGRTAWWYIWSALGNSGCVGEGGAEFTNLDVGVSNGAVWRGGNKLSRVTGSG
jgi:hypothetical protein